MRYVRIFLAQYKFWLMRIFEFRSEVIFWSATSIFWAFAMLAAVSLIFGQVTSIAGWSKYEVMLVMATQELFMGLLWWWVFPSMLAFSQTIRNGNLDNYLVKPIPSQFLVSTMKFEFDNYVRVVVMAGAMWYLVAHFFPGVTALSVAGYLVMLAVGIALFSSIMFLIATLTFYFTTIFNLEDLYDSILSVGKFPAYVFDKGLRVVFFYIIPIAFTTTFPVEVLLGKAGMERIITGIGLTVGFFIAANRFWNFAIRRYASASS